MTDSVISRRLERERTARHESERLLEIKSRDLYQTNQELQNLTDSLEAQVKSRTLELAQARDEAIADSEAKSRFVAIISHEVRSPLNGIIGALSLLNETALLPDQRNYISVAQSSARSMLAIVNNILDYTKIDVGKMKLDMIEYDLYDLIYNVIRIFRFSIKASKKQILLEIEIDSELPKWVIGDETRMRQVIVNIIDNAIKFTNEGKITATLELEKTPNGNSWILFSVRDTGTGISEENQSRLLHEYWSNSQQMSGNVTSTGLGLAISSRLVQLMEGKLGFESTFGSGSFFWFRVPLTPATKSILKPPENKILNALDHQNNISGRVLLAEDNNANQFIVSRILENLGVSVDIASNGFEALDLITNQHYDAVLMDIDMPEMDGISATKLIRELPNQIRASVPIIAVTAHAMLGDKEKFLSNGMDDYLEKPINSSILFECLSKWMPIDPNEKGTANDSSVSENSEIDISILNRLIGEIGAENISSLINMFIDEIESHIDEIELALKTSDYFTIATKGHSLKGSSVSFGAYGLSRIAGEIEENAIIKNADGVLKSTHDLINIRKKIQENLLLALEKLSL
jgi:signal transduction histidine kinase/FixJ family two-component response regulator